MICRVWWAALYCWTATAVAVTAALAGDGLVTDFGPSSPAALTPANLRMSLEPDDAGEGSYAQLWPETRKAEQQASLRLELPEHLDPAGHTSLTARLRAPASTAPVELRWLALDGRGRSIFQRRFTVPPGQQWIVIEEPLRAWRWDNRRVGDWDEVRAVALLVGSAGAGRVDLDDVRFAGRPDKAEGTGWLTDLAFAGRPFKAFGDEGLLVATDAVDAFKDQNLRHLLDNMIRARSFVRRVFGDAFRPTDDHGAPAALLVFEQETEYRAFFTRLGEALRVEIRPPQAQGYTVQDVAATTYRPESGTRRPVYLHESAHAIVARDLRLLTGHPPHAPLQEAIANYLQVCAHPESIDRAVFAKAFDQPIDPTGKGFFIPLEMLFGRPLTTRRYAQLASLVAYLVAEDQELLRDLARALSDGSTATEALKRRKLSWQTLQDRWVAWGKNRFVDDANTERPIFDPPIEFRSRPPVGLQGAAPAPGSGQPSERPSADEGGPARAGGGAGQSGWDSKQGRPWRQWWGWTKALSGPAGPMVWRHQKAAVVESPSCQAGASSSAEYST